MRTLYIEEHFAQSAEEVWSVVGDLNRHDWLPSVTDSRHEDGVRYYQVKQIGEIQQRILKWDGQSYCLEYMVIHGPKELEHHLSIIEIEPNEEGCVVAWTSEFMPEELEELLEQQKRSALKELKNVLAAN